MDPSVTTVLSRTEATAPGVTASCPRPMAKVPFHVMAKPVGSRCNLDCRYCFYLEKAHLYPDGRAFRMSAATLENFVRDSIHAQPGPTVNFAWQGGEPTLLGVEYFRTVVALQQRHAQGKTIENAFQTNGVLLDEAWADFFAEAKFLVGISIDGPRRCHDVYRVDKGQRPTFGRVVAALQLLKRRGVLFNTLTTVHRKNARAALEIYHFLRDVGSGYMQFIPIVERAAKPNAMGLSLAGPARGVDSGDEAPVTSWSVRPADFGGFLCAIFDEWVRRDVGRVFVQHFDSALASWLGLPPGVCVFAKECGRALAVEHNGDVYSCDHYVYPEFKLGNLHASPLATLADSAQQAQFGAAKSATLPRYCRECPVRFACHGECPKHRFARSPHGEAGLNYLCVGYQRFFTHIAPAMETMAGLVRGGRAPAEIMRLRGMSSAGSDADGS